MFLKKMKPITYFVSMKMAIKTHSIIINYHLNVYHNILLLLNLEFLLLVRIHYMLLYLDIFRLIFTNIKIQLLIIRLIISNNDIVTIYWWIYLPNFIF